MSLGLGEWGWGKTLKAKLILCRTLCTGRTQVALDHFTNGLGSRKGGNLFGFSSCSTPITDKKHHERLCFSSQNLKLYERVARTLAWFWLPLPTLREQGSVNVIKCHFAVWSADMEKLLFSSSPLL